MKYDCDPRFDMYYLEDSFVLEIAESDERIAFRLELVLTPKHPLYATPPPSEHHCYRTGALIFEGVRRVNWIERHFRFSTDASGERDLGNIDTFKLSPDGEYELEGSWGDVVIAAHNATITLDAP